MKRFASIAIVSVVWSSNCSSCKSKPMPASDAAPSASVATPVVPSAPLSLPIAADHDARGNVYVVGFVAARGTANLSRFDETGRLAWSIDALTGLTFGPDVHLDVMVSKRGPVVAWRGVTGGKRGRVARLVGEDGALGGNQFAIGAGACASGDSLFWIGSKDAVVEFPLPAGPEKKLSSVSDGYDPTLACGESRAMLVEEGSDDIATRILEGGKASSRTWIVSADELGDDDVREIETFTFGDTLGALFLTESNHLYARRVAARAAPRLSLSYTPAAHEDLMAVDGNADHTVAVLTREANERCDAELATDVIALDIAMPEGPDRVVPLAKGDCGRDLGPYWVAPTTSAVYVAWGVRGPRRGDKAPVEALAWTSVTTPDVKTIPLSAEDLVFAGCTAMKCFFATLARPDNTDGMTPGQARILTIP